MGMLKTFSKVSKNESPIKMIFNGVIYGINKHLFKRKYMIKRIHGYKLKLDLKDPGISRALAIVGTREKETKYILEKVLRNNYWGVCNKNVIDVGANIGYYVMMERNLTLGQIYAFEPGEKNFNDLKRNVELNKCKDVYCYNMAVSNKEGSATMYMSNLSNVHTLLPNDVLNQMSGEQVKVLTIKLSSFIKNVKKHIDLIRMDIEGFEVEVLDDLVKAVKNDIARPAVLFEIHSKKYNEQHSLTEQLKRLMKLGYKFKYMASTKKDVFKEYGYDYEVEIPTDATVRYIYKDIPNKDGLELVEHCRAVLIE